MTRVFEPKREILVVDDDKDLLRAIASAFEGTEFLVHTADSVLSAMQKLADVRVSLVLLDWTFRPSSDPIPGIDQSQGKSVLEKALAIDPFLPVVVMSAYTASLDVANMAFDSGAVSFVMKPLNLSSLVNHLRNLVRRYERLQCCCRVESVEDIKPLDDIERQYVQSVVAVAGSIKEAAARLGKTRQTISKIMKIAAPDCDETEASATLLNQSAAREDSAGGQNHEEQT